MIWPLALDPRELSTHIRSPDTHAATEAPVGHYKWEALQQPRGDCREKVSVPN